MELYQLKTFVTVGRQGNLTSAAELLHLSQSAASTQIKGLESELGVALFERRPMGLTLSRIGQSLMPLAEKALSAAGDVKTKAKTMRGEVSGKLSLGAVVDPSFLRLGEFVNRLMAAYPMLDVEIHQCISSKVMDSVRSGELDAGFFLGSTHNSDLAFVELTRPVYRVVAPAQWRDRIATANWTAIASMPWICTPKQGFHYQMLGEMFREHKLEPSKVIEADREDIIFNLVASGAGLSLMREGLALTAAERGEVTLWGTVTGHTSLSLIYRLDREAAPEIQAALGVIRSIWELPPKHSETTT